ncbi:MAG: hypothetical protein QNJ91_04915 [Gammaproteobacteria bacterium]|nr:hypothetical protein [Gammaproteobacteria bacterium]
MTPIDYQVVGEEDYALKIHIDGDGQFSVEDGTYTTEPPRKGRLTETQSEQVVAAVRQLGIPREHPMPAGATAFEARLTVGEPGEQAVYAFWEGALAEDAELNNLVRLLETL